MALLNKEAVVIVVDVGNGMLMKNKGEDEGSTPLEEAKHCVQMIAQRKIFSESKDEIAVVLFGTEETDNPLAEEGSNNYQHITVLRSLEIVNWDLLSNVQSITGSDKNGDFLDALVVGMDLLVKETKGKKFSSQRILLISNFCSKVSDDQWEHITSSLKNNNFELTVIAPKSYDEEDDDSTSKEKGQSKDGNKSNDQITSENLILNILRSLGQQGETFSFADCLPALTYYQKKKVQSAPWNANLEIGPGLSLAITGYLKVSATKIKSWGNAYAQDTNAGIVSETTYHLNDDAQTQVENNQETVNAYKYGTSLVPFTEEDKASMEYENKEKGLKVLGFTKFENIKRYHYVGEDCRYIVGARTNEDMQVALSAFIHALHETNMVAIVRYAYSLRSAPKVGFLSPRIRPSYECLVFIQLPFLEDIRHLSFPSLESRKKLPTSDQLKTMGELIDAMDLSSVRLCEGEEKVEALKLKETCNPFLQRLYQCLQHRAFHPNDPLPSVPKNILSKLSVPEEVEKLSESVLAKLKIMFPTKNMDKKIGIRTGNKMFENGATSKDENEPPAKKPKTDNQNGNSLVSALMGSVTEVGSINPLSDFKTILKQSLVTFKEACKQLETILKRLLDNQDVALHNKAFEAAKYYREESIKRKEVGQFNLFLKSLKVMNVPKSRQLMAKLSAEKINLVSVDECAVGGLPMEECAKFQKQEAEKIVEEQMDDEDDADDLLNEMGQ